MSSSTGTGKWRVTRYVIRSNHRWTLEMSSGIGTLGWGAGCPIVNLVNQKYGWWNAIGQVFPLFLTDGRWGGGVTVGGAGYPTPRAPKNGGRPD